MADVLKVDDEMYMQAAKVEGGAGCNVHLMNSRGR